MRDDDVERAFDPAFGAGEIAGFLSGWGFRDRYMGMGGHYFDYATMKAFPQQALCVKAAQNIIAKVPDLKMLYGQNDDMTVGAHTALVAAHKDKGVFVVSMNGAP